ncbi:MAG: pitrilysin family protein [Bacteroidota bacterium]
MRKITTMLLACFLFASTSSLLAQEIPTFSPDDIHIAYEKFVLDNGLRLLVHEDHKAPIVAVNVWYHVGSKNEKPGKSGFAHLFEHLMFNGSENFNQDYFQALESIGATDLNGTTNNDRTNYFQNVPKSALDQVLFLESDRMGHLLGAIDQERLDEQRGVVQNEKRQGENQPYGRQYGTITKATYPIGHPYSWTVIGELEHLNAASLEDVKEWFNTYYGTANAVLVIAGDVDPEEVYTKVKKYFGDIAPGPTLVKPEVNISKMASDSRGYYQDRVPESRITRVWNIPEWGSKQLDYLDLASDVLGSGKNSRLYKKMVYEEQVASYAYAYISPKELGSQFIVQAGVKPGKNVEEVEAMMNEVVADFIENGPTEEELKRVKAQYFANYIKGLERIGGFGGKSDILAQHEVYGGNAGFYKDRLKNYAATTTKAMHMTAKEWLTGGSYTLVCDPFPKYAAAAEGVDRSKLPEVGEVPVVKFPTIERKTLKNGLEIVLARREGVSTMVMQLISDAGYSTDKYDKLGLAQLSMNLLDEGTATRTSLEINEMLQLMGASIGTYTDLDKSYVSLNTLKQSLDPSLDLFADVLLNPAFPEAEFDRLKRDQLNNIKREKAQPIQMALRVFPKFLYGTGHAYAKPLTGSGLENTVSQISLEDVKSYYSSYIRPNNSVLTVVGDISMKELTTKLESKLSSWKKGKTPPNAIVEVSAKKGGVLYLMDRPESQQSVIIGGYLVSPYGQVSEIAREAMMNVLGGDFTSRLNMNLREDKHWAYGAGSFLLDAQGQRPLLAYAPVQTDKTKESIIEIQKEMNMFIGEKPVTQAEFDKNKQNTILKLAGRWETNGSVNGSIGEIVRYGLNDTYYDSYSQEVKNLSLGDVHKSAKQLVKPENMMWFVVGDKEKILPGLQELELDKIVMIDADGNILDEDMSSSGSSSSGR